jgi:hypothetical protein
MKRDIVWTTKFKRIKSWQSDAIWTLACWMILIYRIEDDVLALTLSRTGTHSDLFGK